MFCISTSIIGIIFQEHNVELLQLKILDQLRLVVANQKTVVWISASMPIVFTPKQTGILVNSSRIIVKIDAFNSLQNYPNIPVTATKETEVFKNIGAINKAMIGPYLNIPKKMVLRGLPIDSDGKRNLIHPYIVFIHEDFIEDKFRNSTVILSTMTNIPSMLQENDEDAANGNRPINDVCVEIVPIDSVIYRSLCREVYNKNIPTVLIPKSLNTIVNVENGMKLIFIIVGDKIEQPDHIDIVTYSDKTQTESDVIEQFKNCVIKSTHSGKKFLINNGIIKQNTEISYGFLQFKLKPEKLKFTMLNSESFRNCTISAKCLTDAEMTAPKLVVAHFEYDYKNYCRTMKSVEALIEKILSHVYFEIYREANFKGASEIKSNVLVTGKIYFYLYIMFMLL